jgi:uncharacterized delta-60 repeat protein
MFVARLNAAGELDARFGVGGIVSGTPRGLSQIDFIVPLAGGGYIAVQNTGAATFTTACRVVRLRPNGSVDTSFGPHGARNLGMFVDEVLVQPDGKILLVGHAPPRFPQQSDAGSENVIVRLNADGTLDHSFAEPDEFGASGIAGIAFVGDRSVDDEFFFRADVLTSAALDNSGRILLALTGSGTHLSQSDEHLEGGGSSVYLQRLGAEGSADQSFGDADLHRATVREVQWDADAGERPADDHRGVVAVRPDGNIAVLERHNIEKDAPAVITLVGDDGTVSSNHADLSNLFAGFTVPLLRDGSMTALADNSLIVAGTMTSNGNASPALVRLKTDLTVDTSFGNNGVMLLATTDGVSEANDVAIAPDGTVTAVANPPRVNVLDDRSGEGLRIARVFADDHPVVTLGRVRNDGETVRLTVTIRGVHPIDTTSLDDDDLRLIHEGGGRTKLRLVNFVESGGVVTAQYRVRRDLASAFITESVTVRTVAGQILDDAADANVARDLGTIAIT